MCDREDWIEVKGYEGFSKSVQQEVKTVPNGSNEPKGTEVSVELQRNTDHTYREHKHHLGEKNKRK